MFVEKNKPLRIIYVGRLEVEKWADILLSILHQFHDQYQFPIEWEICGEGSMLWRFQALGYSNVHTHGYLDGVELNHLRKTCHVAFMPSRFLETFGLVALESIQSGLTVVGFRKGGLIPFIHDAYALDELNPIDSFARIIENILQATDLYTVNISWYSLSLWREHLRMIIWGADRILLVSDYMVSIWGTEKYIFFLRDELQNMGKKVAIYGYNGSVPKWKRVFLLFLNPFLFWHFFSLRREVGKFQPDVIWWHSLLRYIGFWGILALVLSKARTIITHHDLWLIAPHPSRVYALWDIPSTLSLGLFLRGSSNVISILSTSLKWLYLRILWILLSRISLHLVPSEFLISYYRKNTPHEVRVFSHTNF